VLSRNLEKTLHHSLALANDRHHEYATAEHLLLALTEDQDAVSVFRACAVDIDRLRSGVLKYVDNELSNLVRSSEEDAKPTATFQRVVQRAAILVKSSGRGEVSGADVLVALFAERDSHAVYFLQEQDMTRFDALNYINHGIAKTSARANTLDTAEIRRQPETMAAASLLARALDVYTGNDRPQTERKKVFISYSHRDRRWISRLEVHLKPIFDLGVIEYWHDGMISPGRKWWEEISASIEKSQIAILLVSADFLASDFISRNELPPLLKKAEEDGCHILPIIAGPCRFLRHDALAEFQSVNPPSRPLSGMNSHDRETLFVRVADTIERILENNPSQ
jgi:hypothetical protein